MSTGPQNLDTRLLRFRTRRGDEAPAALASDLLEAARAQDALEVTASALKASPTDGELLLLDGRARLATSDLLGAQAALLKAAKALPQRKDPFRWLGDVLLKRGDPERAAKVLERALAIDPSDPAVAQLHARALRLANVASGVDEPKPTPAAEERTVMRTDLTEQLRSMTAAVDAAEAAGADDDLEEEPTNVLGRAQLAEALRAAEAPRGGKRRPARTMEFGSAEAPAIPPPPRMPAEAMPVEPMGDVAHATDGEIEDALGALGASPAPARPLSSFPAMPHKRSAPPAAKPPARPAKPLAPAKPLPPAGKPPDAKLAPSAKLGAPPARPLAAPPAAKRPPPFAPSAPLPPALPKRQQAAPIAPEPPPSSLFAEPEDAPAGLDDAQVEPERPRGPAPEPARPFFPTAGADDGWPPSAAPEPAHSVDAAADDAAADDAWPPTAEPDLPATPSEPEDVDAILGMLRSQGLFEPPTGEPAQWAKRAEVKAAKKTQASGTRIGIWLGAVWVLAIGAAVGGWYGWQWYVGENHRKAGELVTEARAEAHRGAHADLVDAERHLREARDLNPHDTEGPTLLLFVHAQRALEDGAFEAGFLRPTVTRSESLEVDAAYLDAARAVLAAAEGGHEQATAHLASALEARPSDGAILYLAGRLEQRLGGESALAHLEAAIEAEEALVAPRIALAEVRYDEGNAEGALELLDQVLAREDDHLRAKLWRAFMTTDGDEPGPALAALDALEERVRQHGAPTDHVVRQLARARLLRRQGEVEPAGEAVDLAIRAGASEPRLLALVATEGRRAGRLLRAQQAATAAVSGAPDNTDFRKLLAEIQLARRDGRGALSTLAELDAADPDVLAMRGAAALLLDTDEALRAAVAGLDAQVAADAESSVEVRALRLRMHARLGDDVLAEARALAREVPGDAGVALALGEAALAARQAATAVEALGQAVRSSPDDAEGHYLLGRARRMAGDGEGAEQSLRRALELLPEHADARFALGGLLLDMGSYEAADTLYAELGRSSRSAGGQAATVAGRLGRVEALTGLGRLDDAAVQLEGLQADARALPSTRLAAARLALARGRAGDALTEVRPLATAEGASAAVLALYADALLAAGQAEPAADAYAAAIAADGGLPEALLGQAEMAVRSDRDDDALALLNQLGRALETRIRPPALRARMHLLRGRAHLLGGRNSLAPAREALREAVAIEGAPAAAHFFLGEALAGEDSQGARAAYERYLELAPEGEYAARARRAIRR